MPKGLRRSSKKQAVAQLVRVLNERSAKLQQEPFWEKEYDSLILADGPKGTYSMDPHISQVNNNVLVIAGTGTTAIDAPVTFASQRPDAWYTLDGRRLSGKPSQKGVYINGGVKVVIK